MLRPATLAAFAGLALCGAAPAAAPRRIMSVNLCADLPLLMLVPRARIASVTYLAHPLVAALIPGADAGVAINHGAAEEMIVQRPNLILAGPGLPPVVRRLAAQRGTPIIEVARAPDFPAIRRQTLRLGAALGVPARAAALVRAMDGDLAALAAAAPPRPLRVIAWSGGDAVPGRGTLTDAIITAAGAENIGRRPGDRTYSSYGMEELLLARPDAVLLGTGQYDEPSLHQGRVRRPLLAQAFAGRLVDYPEAAYACGWPQAARAAAALRRALAAVPPRGGR